MPESLQWLEDVQRRFATDHTLFLQEDLNVPSDAHTELQKLSTPQLCRLLLVEGNTLTKMRIKAQFKKRRRTAQHMPGEAYVSCLHLIDFGYSLDDIPSLTPAQLLCVGMHPDATMQSKHEAVLALRTLLTFRQRSRKLTNTEPIVPRKRSHSPTLKEQLRAVKREISPDLLARFGANAGNAEPLEPEEMQHATIYESPLMEWFDMSRRSSIAWDPRLYLRQIDLAEALDDMLRSPPLPPLSDIEFRVLKYVPLRTALPPLPADGSAYGTPVDYISGSLSTDLEVLEYLFEKRVSSGHLSWFIALASPGLKELIRALGKVIEAKSAARRCWDELEYAASKRDEYNEERWTDAEANLDLIQDLKDEYRLQEFFFPRGKAAGPRALGIRRLVSEKAFKRLEKFAKEWSKQDC